MKINYELSKCLQKDVDLVVLNDIKNILTKGTLIKGDVLRVDIEILKQHDIFDYKSFRRYIDGV